jgi:predicted nucleic acid-binding protein
MEKLKLYLDTTVWNFAFADDAPAYQTATLEFFQRVRMGLYKVFCSEMVVLEIEATRTARRDLMMKLLREIAPHELEPRVEIEALAAEYIKRKVLSEKSRADAAHVAYATFYEMDALVSWNFRHLANVNRRKRVVALNLEKGYNFPVDLVTPLEVLGDEKD